MKIRVFLVMVKFVSACVERDKKNFEKMDFCSYPPAHLVDFWQSLIGTDGVESKADLARYLGISRARVTQVLRRLQP